MRASLMPSGVLEATVDPSSPNQIPYLYVSQCDLEMLRDAAVHVPPSHAAECSVPGRMRIPVPQILALG
jgi:hypothetical protein